jgi:hypothetical protein
MKEAIFPNTDKKTRPLLFWIFQKIDAHIQSKTNSIDIRERTFVRLRCANLTYSLIQFISLMHRYTQE